MKKSAQKPAARKKPRRKNPAVPPSHFREFLKALSGAIQNKEPIQFHTYPELLEQSHGFAEAVMAMTAEELNEFERERLKLAAGEIMEMGKVKYEIPCYDLGCLLFQMGTEIMTHCHEEFLKQFPDGGGAKI